MHTPKGARRVGGCGGDRKSDDDNTVGGWMMVYGVASVSVLTYRLRERGNQEDRQGHGFHALFTPNNTPHGAVDTHV